MSSSQFKKLLGLFGLLNLVSYLAQGVMSYALISVVPFGIEQRNEARIFDSLANDLWFLGGNVQRIIIGDSAFQNETIFLITALLPVLLPSITFVVLLRLLSDDSRDLPSEIAASLYRWSVLFILAASIGVPILSQDFWLSAAWGRMAAAGSNPYYVNLTSEFAQNIPLDDLAQLMTYGPLWAVLSGIIALIAGSSGLMTAVLFKLLLAGAWICALRLIWKLLGHYSLRSQSLGLLVVGWLPIWMVEVGAEGHNDIVMVVPLLLWLFLLERGQVTLATIALAASALIKYTTAPIFALELLYLIYSTEKPFRSYLPSFLYAGIFFLATFAIFYRSPDFFASMTSMREWHFFTPQEAIGTFLKLTRLPLLGWLRIMPQVIFVVISVLSVYRYMRSPDQESFRYSILAVMSAILYCALGHVWPWYMLWVLPFAALAPRALLSRWNIGVALAFPLIMLVVQLDLPEFHRWGVTGLIIYAFAVVWLLFRLPSQVPLNEVLGGLQSAEG